MTGIKLASTPRLPLARTGERFAEGLLAATTDPSAGTGYCYGRYGNVVSRLQPTKGRTYVLRRSLNENYQPGFVEDTAPGDISEGNGFDKVGNSRRCGMPTSSTRHAAAAPATV